MELTIYKNGEAVKTFKSDSFELTFGAMEDIANAMDLDSIAKGTNEEIIANGMNLMKHAGHTVRGLLHEIFNDITDEDIRHARVKDIIRVLVEAVNHTIAEIEESASKN